jgi:hypothetical protein
MRQQQACGVMSRQNTGNWLEAGVIVRALSLCERTPGVEPAAGRDRSGTSRLAPQGHAALGQTGLVAPGGYGTQRLGIWMLRSAQHVSSRSRLNETAEVHHRYSVGEVGSNGQVMGDHDDAHALFPAELTEQRHYAGPNRDVQH